MGLGSGFRVQAPVSLGLGFSVSGLVGLRLEVRVEGSGFRVRV